MNKIISSGDINHNKIKRGVNIVSDSVSCTLGPKGRTVLVQKGPSYFVASKDGVFVAREIQLEDPLENAGASFVIAASMKSNELAGDGTTTAVVLTQAIYNKGRKHNENDINPILFNSGMRKALKIVVDELQSQAIPVKDDYEKIKNVASISANNDETIGTLISDCMKEIGTDGMITLEESPNAKTYYKRIEGLFLDMGMASDYFTTSGGKVLNQLNTIHPIVGGKESTTPVHVLLIEDKISEFKYLAPVLRYCNLPGVQAQLLIIANEMDGEALSSIALNHQRKLKTGTGLLSCVVQTPGYGDAQLEYLRDIAAMTGATIISSKLGTSFDGTTCNPEIFGKCEKTIVTQHDTTILGAQPLEGAKEKRIAEVKERLDAATEPIHKEALRKRIARMAIGIGIVYIGGYTREEVLEKRFRVEDAVCATKAAVEEGIIVGGGAALVKISKKVVAEAAKETDIDIKTGMTVIAQAIQVPLETIVNNGGGNGKSIVEAVKALPGNQGYDANSGVYCDLMEAGIIDPVKVVRVALESAVSAAGTLLTTEATIAVKPIEVVQRVEGDRIQ